MPVAAMLFIVGYHYVCSVQIDICQQMHLICTAALLGLCLFGGIFLLADSRKMRADKIFAMQMLLVALAAGLSLIKNFIEGTTLVSSPEIISPSMLIYGNIFAFILLMYPFDVFYRGRTTLWKYFLLFLPALLCGLFFYGYLLLSGDRITQIMNLQELSDNFYRFEVWFRIVLLVYPIGIFICVLYQKKRYIDWYRRDFSNADCFDLGWLEYYLFGYFLVIVSYLMIMTTGSRQGLLMHSLALLLFFGGAFYQILRYKATDPSEFPESEDPIEPKAELVVNCGLANCAEGDDKFRFVDKILHYKTDLERWMQEQKPYKNKDFKLLDVMQVLPLNRSYISRLFNEGYGETFFDFVMRYRLEESVHLMEQYPEMNIRRISDLCGFSSPSVFGRAFLKKKGVTPKQYRRDMDLEI